MYEPYMSVWICLHDNRLCVLKYACALQHRLVCEVGYGPILSGWPLANHWMSRGPTFYCPNKQAVQWGRIPKSLRQALRIKQCGACMTASLSNCSQLWLLHVGYHLNSPEVNKLQWRLFSVPWSRASLLITKDSSSKLAINYFTYPLCRCLPVNSADFVCLARKPVLADRRLNVRIMIAKYRRATNTDIHSSLEPNVQPLQP